MRSFIHSTNIFGVAKKIPGTVRCWWHSQRLVHLMPYLMQVLTLRPGHLVQVTQLSINHFRTGYQKASQGPGRDNSWFSSPYMIGSTADGITYDTSL